MADIKIQRAEKEDAPYIEEKLRNYILDDTNASWEQFFVAKLNNKTVAFARIIDHGEFFESASLGVDYYHRGNGIGVKLLCFIVKEARRLDPKKPIYGVSHRPGFAKKAGFKIVPSGPEAIELKKSKCKLPAEIVKFPDRDTSI